jgi:hypothetical protein
MSLYALKYSELLSIVPPLMAAWIGGPEGAIDSTAFVPPCPRDRSFTEGAAYLAKIAAPSAGKIPRTT